LKQEYIRHGVVALIANWHIAKGQVITPTVGTTRTEEDFCEHINKTIETDPEAGWISWSINLIFINLNLWYVWLPNVVAST
jgi:hypothetical protein